MWKILVNLELGRVKHLQLLNTVHFQYQALKLFPETGCICIYSDCIFILLQKCLPKKKKNPTLRQFGQLHVDFFHRLNNTIAIAKKKKEKYTKYKVMTEF